MKIKELYEMTFDEAIEELYDENDNITSYEILKEFIIEQINNDDIGLAEHLLSAIWNDTSIGESNYYKYDYSMGTFETPTALNTLEDLEQFCED